MVLPTFSFALNAEEDRALAVTPNPAAALAASESATTYPELRIAISYKIALSPHSGADQLDRDTQTAQRRVREAPEPRPFLEQLGWLYVAKARASFDPGFYNDADQGKAP